MLKVPPRLALRNVYTSIPQIPSRYLPVAFLLSSAAATLTTPIRHSLFVSAVAWLGVAAHYYWKLRGSSTTSYSGENGGNGSKRRKLSGFAGLLYALAQLCERAPTDRISLWWTQSLLPVFIYLILQLDLLGDAEPYSNGTIHINGAIHHGQPKIVISGRLLLAVSATSALILSTALSRSSDVALGLCSSLLIACFYLLLDHVLRTYRDERQTLNSVEGLMRRPRSLSVRDQHNVEAIMRDTAFSIGLLCAICSVLMESFRGNGLIDRPNPTFWNTMGIALQSWQPNWWIAPEILGLVFESLRVITLLSLLLDNGAFSVSLLGLSATVLARLIGSISLAGVWFGTLFGVAVSLMLDDSYPIPIISTIRGRSRMRQLILLLTTLTILGTMFSNLRLRVQPRPLTVPPLFPGELPIEELGPLHISDTTTHPIDQLVRDGEARLQERLSRQTNSLPKAVGEYRRRYKIAPPPNFDIWYEFARRRNVKFIDEFDHINEMLTPFWGIPPKTLRARVTEAIGFSGNFLMTFMIREGTVVKLEGGADWQQRATLAMLSNFVHHLPDMDLAFNVHDEPRVILAYDTLRSIMKIAEDEKKPAAAAVTDPRNRFSASPADLSSGKRLPDVRTTRFNVFAHQPTWTHSRISCPPDSPARSFDDTGKDNLTSFAVTNLGFIYNHTAFADICQLPSLSTSYGFFDRPNAYNLVQDLVPIFSQSKIASYQDIIYPSPWYWANMVEYNKTRDMDWNDKKETLYWRGSTTGGFSRNGGWRRHHRQRLVKKINEPGPAQIVHKMDDGKWQPLTIRRQDFTEMIDIKFSHVGQCDPEDCDAQKEFFHVVDRVDQQDAWSYKHLLDMDGNAFSGRFYAFLRSKSLIYKMNLFQEWHRDWVVPWAHYIPLSLRADEWLEAVRWFSSETEGREQAERIAKRSTEWVESSLRNEDLEVWFFRLLLEYGRIVDDNREIIGYAGP